MNRKLKKPPVELNFRRSQKNNELNQSHKILYVNELNALIWVLLLHSISYSISCLVK